MTNDDKHSASLTNQNLGSGDMTWDEATFSWDSAPGTWNNPYTFSSEDKHSASLTNQNKS